LVTKGECSGFLVVVKIMSFSLSGGNVRTIRPQS
jgi:hypothetical protein